MIFDTMIGKPACDGSLVKKFLEKYDQATGSTDNIGSKLINEMFPESHLTRICTSLESERF